MVVPAGKPREPAACGCVPRGTSSQAAGDWRLRRAVGNLESIGVPESPWGSRDVHRRHHAERGPVGLRASDPRSGGAAQTPAELEAEPIVKLEPGETEVEGQCLTEQELDLIARLNALRRPTLGVEGDAEGDDPAPFDPHYFVGRWEVEGVLPDSPLAESSEFVGTETVRHVEGCTYAAPSRRPPSTAT